MTTKGTPDYKRTLARWAALTRAQDERGLTASEGAELRTLHAQLHAVEQASFAALTDDYEFAMRQVGDLSGAEL